MELTKANLSKCILALSSSKFLSLDIETNGEDIFQSPRSEIVSCSISMHNLQYTFFGENLALLKYLPIDQTQTIFIHNAKYDLAYLKKFGFDIFTKNIFCTYAMARIEKNNRLNMSLDVLAKEIKLEKSKDIKKYMDANKLFEWVLYPGKKKRTKKYHYHKVPKDILIDYNEKDALVGYKLGIHQVEKLTKDKKVYELVRNEKALTKVLLSMEENGIMIDQEYTRKALAYEIEEYQKAASEFEKMSGIPFQDANSVLYKAFTAANEKIHLTEKGNPTFDADHLALMTSPLAEIVKRYRTSYKRAGTYFQTFLDKTEHSPILHCNFKQGGCVTGRMSCADPNLQNVVKRKDKEAIYPVRRSFVPRPDKTFFMIDYNQMEYILLMDQAEEMEVIEQVKNGVDVHEATGKLLNLTRDIAKTVNFALLYGVGSYHLAEMLGISEVDAKFIKNNYFIQLPNIARYVRKIIKDADSSYYLYNWFGRKYHFDKREISYKAPNYIIQGGCADIIKIAMVRIHEFLKDYPDSKMLLQIHDELLFEIPKKDYHILPKIKQILESVYPHKHLPLTVSIDYSNHSWHDKEAYEY